MKKNIILSIFCVVLMLFILLYPSLVIEETKTCLNLWANSIFPSLFPFFVLTSMLKQSSAIETILHKTKLNYTLFFTSLIGVICGYPSTSKLIGDSNLDMSFEDVYALSTAPNPIFIIGTVATIFLGNRLLGIYMLVSIYLALITSFFISKFIFRLEKAKAHTTPIKANSLPFGEMLIRAILDGFTTQFTIIGIIILTAIISLFLSKLKAFDLAAKLLTPLCLKLHIPAVILPEFLKGLMEMTTGVTSVCSLNISLYHKIVACTFLTSFGGFAIIIESLAFIKGKIKATHIITLKLIHGVLSVIYVRLLLLIYPASSTTFLKVERISFPNLFVLNSLFCIGLILILHRILRQDL